jgi:hypothetical protein
MTNTKNILAGLLTIAAAFSTSAQADGFRCSSAYGDLNIAVYNHTDAEEGTRNAAIMILSDPRVQEGNKTIARFQDVTGLLENYGAKYVAKVDLRYADSSRKGELVAGTKLGELNAVVLDVEFSYSSPVSDNEPLRGKVTLHKRNGQRMSAPMVCNRYLKQG